LSKIFEKLQFNRLHEIIDGSHRNEKAKNCCAKERHA